MEDTEFRREDNTVFAFGRAAPSILSNSMRRRCEFDPCVKAHSYVERGGNLVFVRRLDIIGPIGGQLWKYTSEEDIFRGLHEITAGEPRPSLLKRSARP